MGPVRQNPIQRTVSLFICVCIALWSAVPAVDVQAAVAKVQEMTTKAQENAGGKVTESDVQSMQSRADVVTYAVLAELHHFEQYRIGDFRDYVTRYLQGQIEFYKTASSSWSCRCSDIPSVFVGICIS